MINKHLLMIFSLMKWDKIASQLSFDAATPQNSWKMQAYFLLLLFYMVELFGSPPHILNALGLLLLLLVVFNTAPLSKIYGVLS